MKIAILDVSTKNHASLIENWLKTCQVNGWQVELYISTDVLNNINPKLIEEINIIEYKGSWLLGYLNNIYKNYQKGVFDKLIITSLQSNYFSFFFSKIKKTDFLLTIHNVNAWVGKCNKNKLRYFTKYLIRRYYLMLAKKLIVSSDNLVSELITHNIPSEKITIMPFKLAKEDLQSFEKKYIVYPGIISKDRKSYEVFYNLCHDFQELNFVLLGRAEYESDQIIINRFKQLDNVITFNDYVPRDEFNHYIERALLVFGDINVNYENFEFTEVYGKTKDSGLSYFTVEQRVPLLINKEFENHQVLSDMTYYFSTQDEAKNELLYLVKSQEVYPVSALKDYQIATVADRFNGYL